MPDPMNPKKNPNPSDPMEREDTMPDRQRSGERQPARQPGRPGGTEGDKPGLGNEKQGDEQPRRDMEERRPHRDRPS